MENYSLYMTMLGCKPKGRLTEQHDIFFGIAEELKELIPDCQAFWPEDDQKIHFDAWRNVQYDEHYRIHMMTRYSTDANCENRTYCINMDRVITISLVTLYT